MDYNENFYELIDEDGNEQVFEMLDTIVEDGQRYFAFMPVEDESSEKPEGGDDEEEENVLVVLKEQPDPEGGEGDVILVSVDDDEEFDKIGKIFLDRLEEMFSEEAAE